MSVREIPADEWVPFLDQFNRDHRAWLATVERVRPGAPRDVQHPEAAERPLAAVTPEIAGRRVGGIKIQFQQDTRAANTLRIDAPKRLRVSETADGAARALEIEDASGECTRIRFRAVAPAEALDGIAPGEV